MVEMASGGGNGLKTAEACAEKCRHAGRQWGSLGQMSMVKYRLPSERALTNEKATSAERANGVIGTTPRLQRARGPGPKSRA